MEMSTKVAHQTHIPSISSEKSPITCQLSPISNQSNQVIVIGSGLSGLSCAAKLSSHGVQTTVLESRGRIGGRTWTVDINQPIEENVDAIAEKIQDKQLKIDLGAAWIHGIKHNPIYDRFKGILKVHDTATGVICHPKTGLPLDKATSDLIWGRTFLTFELVTNFAKAHPNCDMSWRQVVDKLLADKDLRQQLLKNLKPDAEEAAVALLQEIMANYEGASPEEFAAIQEAATHQLQGREPIVVNGYGQVVHALAKELKKEVLLSHQVSKISWSEKGVVVDVNGKSFHADSVVCTLPLGVLKKHHSTIFSPSLPANKVKAIESLGMGLLDKVVMQWDEPWWDKDVNFATFVSRSQFSKDTINQVYVLECLDLSHIVKQPVLVFITSHHVAKTVEGWTDDVIQDYFVGLLTKTYDTHVPLPKKTVATRWWQDPHALGAYTYIPSETIHSVKETHEHIESIAEPLLDQNGVPRVYFAGEHTSKYWFSFAHGAYQSGLDAAMVILKGRLSFDSEISVDEKEARRRFCCF